MTGWTIVPKGEGDLDSRVKMNPGSHIGIQLTIFPRKDTAEVSLKKMPPETRKNVEVVEVNILLALNGGKSE